MNFQFPWNKSKSIADRLRAVQSPVQDAPSRDTSPILPESLPMVVQVEESGEAVLVHGEPEPPVGPERSIEAERSRALADPLYLANSVLGFELQPEHQILFDALLDEKSSDVLVMWPRGSGKTSCVSVAVVQQLIRNPNLRILYVTSDIDLGKRRLSQIANVFDNPTPTFRQLFPDFCDLESRIAQEFVVKGRNAAALTEPSFSVSTPLATKTGSHFDLMILDDFVTEANSVSENSRENVCARYQQCRNLGTGTKMRTILCGTPYHSDDLLWRVRKAAERDMNSGWRVEIRSCWQHACATCGHKELFHERATGSCRICAKSGRMCLEFKRGERGVLIDRTESCDYGFTVESLLIERGDTRKGPKVFASQMEIDVRPEAGLSLPVFTTEFLDQHTEQTPGLGNLPVAFIVLDVGLRPNEPSADPLAHLNDPDASVMFAVTTALGPATPIDADGGQWDVDTLASRVYKFMQRYPNAPLYTENIDSWPAIRSLIEKCARGATLDIRTFPAPREANAKLLRIGRLHGAMASRRVGLYYALPGIDVLRRQLRGKNYKSEGHDDFADCAAMIAEALEMASLGSPAFAPLSGRSVGPWSGGDRPLCLADPAEWRRWNESRTEDEDSGSGSFSF